MSVFLFTRMIIVLWAAWFIWAETGPVTTIAIVVLYLWNEANSDAFEKAVEAIRDTDERLEQVTKRG